MMEDASKTKKHLLEELSELRGRVLSLERSNQKLKRDKNALKQSEKRFRLIFENAPEGIYQTTPEGRFLSMNPAFAHICGYDSPEEMIHNIIDIKKQLYVNPEDREQVKKALAEQGILKDFETRFSRKDGAIIWVSIYAQTLKDEDGKTVYQGTIEDITERKRAEEALQESEEKYRHLVTYAPAAIYEVDLASRRFISVNEIMCQLTGYSREEFFLMDPMQLLSEESRGVFMERIARAFSGEQVPDTVEYRIKGKNEREMTRIIDSNVE